MTISKYAQHRGVSRAAVQQAIQAGRIVATPADENGFRWIESETADAAWDENTAHQKRRNTADTANGSASGPAPRPSALGHSEAVTDARPKAVSATQDYEPDLDPDTDGAEEQDNTYSAARARKEHYAAEMARLKLEELSGTLVSADAVREQWTAIGTLVRTKVLAIPSKVRQRALNLSDDQFFLLEEIVRSCLEDLTHGDD